MTSVTSQNNSLGNARVFSSLICQKKENKEGEVAGDRMETRYLLHNCIFPS